MYAIGGEKERHLTPLFIAEIFGTMEQTSGTLRPVRINSHCE